LPGIDSELGEALYLAGHLQRAERALERAMQSQNTPARVFFLISRVYTKTHRLVMAEMAQHRFVAAAPDPATGFRNLGRLLATQNDFAGAEAAYRRALTIEPGHRATQVRLESVLRRQ
jgi:Tfp pilus assembly protein PilF